MYNESSSFKFKFLATAIILMPLTLGLASVPDELDTKLAELVRQITISLTEENKTKIAVIEFSNLDGKVTEFGKFLSEELITRLFITKKFEVVERQLLVKILEEHKLNLTGIVDPVSAKELGKILGVDAIASGTITDLGTSVKLNARLIATETGKIFAVASVEMLKDEKIRKLMGRLSDDKREDTTVETPAKSFGLKVEYFNLMPFTASPPPFGEPVSTGIDQLIDFAWGNDAPAKNVSVDYWGARWTGFLFAPITGTYFFTITHRVNDGVRLFINDELIHEFWSFPNESRHYWYAYHDLYDERNSKRVSVYMDANKWYRIKLEFYNINDTSSLRLKWIPPGTSELQLIPSRYLKPQE
jgi:TolB-like protein